MKNKILIWSAFTAYLLYHLYNLLAVFLIPTLPPAPVKYRDRSTRELASFGYLVRFGLGQVPPMIFKSPIAPEFELFPRWEGWSLFPDGIHRRDRSLQPIILSTVNQLEASGINVIIVPVPTRSSIERRRLPNPPPAENIWRASSPESHERAAQIYRRFATMLSSRTINLFDPFTRYLAANPSERLYLYSDYHWNSLGIAIALREIVEKLKVEGWAISQGPISLIREEPLQLHWLQAHFLLPEWAASTLLSKGPAERIFELKAVSKESRKTRIILAGSSFSSGYEKHGIWDQLHRIFSGFPLHNFSNNNGSYHGSFKQMEKKKFVFRPGDLLIWEFPVTSLDGNVQPIEIASLLPVLPIPPLLPMPPRSLSSVEPASKMENRSNE